jgi:hypothetical protein
LRLLVLFYGQRDGEKQVFYYIKNIVNTPINGMLLTCKGRGINKKKKGRGKVDENGEDNPEFL